MIDKAIITKEFQKRLRKDFFHDVPVILDEKVSGQKLTEDGRVRIGPWAGPESCYSNLVHEMAHLVEIDRPRITEFGWGLRYGKFWEISLPNGYHSGYECSTDQQVHREERVWALQLNLFESYGIDIPVADMVSSAVFLPAFCYVRPGRGNWKWTNKEKSRLEVVAKRVSVKRRDFTAEMFRSEWKSRMEYLREKPIKKDELCGQSKATQ